MDKLSELPWEEVNKNREATFYSMKGILVHIIDNEDRMVNWVIQNKPKEYKPFQLPEEYTEMSQLTKHLVDVESKTKKYFESLDEAELERRVIFTTAAGKDFNLSVEEVLFQSFTEQLYHMGELIALLWQNDIEPPQMQWFWNNPREKTA